MIYTYRCTICDHVQERRRMMAERHDPLECENCAGETKLIITPVEFQASFLGSHKNPGYMCPVTDQWIDSKAKRRRAMDENDMTEKA